MARSTNPFRYFDSSPDVIRLVVMMYVKYPLSLRNVEDPLFERGVDICHETVRLGDCAKLETSCRWTDGVDGPCVRRLSAIGWPLLEAPT